MVSFSVNLKIRTTVVTIKSQMLLEIWTHYLPHTCNMEKGLPSVPYLRSQTLEWQTQPKLPTSGCAVKGLIVMSHWQIPAIYFFSILHVRLKQRPLYEKTQWWRERRNKQWGGTINKWRRNVLPFAEKVVAKTLGCDSPTVCLGTRESVSTGNQQNQRQPIHKH